MKSMRIAAREGLVQFFRHHQRFVTRLLWIIKDAHPEIPLVLDYPIPSVPRYTPGGPHPALHTLIHAHRATYQRLLTSFATRYREPLGAIATEVDEASEPYWANPYQPPLDALALYSLMAMERPRLYMEVGSGHSTTFARRAIRDHDLPTTLVSIDPAPRADIDALCDQVVRTPLEASDLSLFHRLQAGDMLFIDSSHRCFMHSDVTVFMLEILPALPPGVLVHLHDIFLPFDYPAAWAHHFFSEQYLLACYLLAPASRLEILLPNYYVSQQPSLTRIVAPLWPTGVQPAGQGFWMRTL